MFKGVRHKMGVSSSPPSQFAENLLITQWHNRQWDTFLMLLVAAVPFDRDAKEPKTREDISAET